MYKPKSSQPSSGCYSFSADTLSRSADLAAVETRFSCSGRSFPKRQENLACLDRTSFCRRSSGRPLTAARLLPFQFSVVSGAQTCPFSFVTAPTLSDASDMFDFPYPNHSRSRRRWKSLAIKPHCGSRTLCDVIARAGGKLGLEDFGQNATYIGCRYDTGKFFVMKDDD